MGSFAKGFFRSFRMYMQTNTASDTFPTISPDPDSIDIEFSKHGALIACPQVEVLDFQNLDLNLFSKKLSNQNSGQSPVNGFILGVSNDPLNNKSPEGLRNLIETILSHGVKVWLKTKHLLDLNLLELIAKSPGQIHLLLSFQASFKQDNVAIHQKLKQVSHLKHLGVDFDIYLEELSPENIQPSCIRYILRELATRGIEKIFCCCEYTSLDSEKEWNQKNQSTQLVLPFLGSRMLHSKQSRSSCYSKVMGLGQLFGIKVHIDLFTNPDFRKEKTSSRILFPTNLKQKFLQGSSRPSQEDLFLIPTQAM